MTVKIGDYDFEGPFESTAAIEDKPGIYAVLHFKEGDYYLLDVGESSQIKNEIEEHDREEWENNSKGKIEYSAFYTPRLEEDDRREIEERIRMMYALS